MADKKNTEQKRYRALAFVKGDSLAKEKDSHMSEDELPTWPYLVRKESLAAIIVTIILLVWSIALNAPLEDPSDPSVTPNPAKAPWYFLGLQEMLVYFDPWIAGVIFPSLIVMGLMAMPYIDINPKGNGYYTFKERWFAILTFCFGFHILWMLLIIVGVFMRGPGWLWFWPWQEWDAHRIVADTNYDLTQFIGIDSKSLLGSVIGGGVITVYFFLGMVIPFLFLKVTGNRTLEKLGIIRYSLVAFLFLSMMGLPIKVFLKLVFHLKYIWVTPWFNI
jgi:hypothetical protein